MDQAVTSGLGIDQSIWNALRHCQKNAIRCGIDYLNNPLDQQGHKACLLSLPTGAGKSGVIATLHITRHSTRYWSYVIGVTFAISSPSKLRVISLRRRRQMR